MMIHNYFENRWKKMRKGIHYNWVYHMAFQSNKNKIHSKHPNLQSPWLHACGGPNPSALALTGGGGTAVFFLFFFSLIHSLLQETEKKNQFLSSINMLLPFHFHSFFSLTHWRNKETEKKCNTIWRNGKWEKIELNIFLIEDLMYAILQIFNMLFNTISNIAIQ
jgi:hypothetical protein